MRKHALERHRLTAILAAIVLTAWAIGCSDAGSAPGETRVRPLNTMAEFDAAVAGDSEKPLVMIDFYADWCAPCQVLSPLMDTLSVTYADRVAVYKVDVDKLNPVLDRFGITAIPYVLFFKNGRPIKALPGLQPESAYRNAIRDLS